MANFGANLQAYTSFLALEKMGHSVKIIDYFPFFTMSLSGLGIAVYLLLIYVFGNLFIDSTGIILAVAATSIIGGVIQPLQTHKILKGTAKGIWNK